MPVRAGIDEAGEKAARARLAQARRSRSARTADRTGGCRACWRTPSDRRRCCPCDRSTTHDEALAREVLADVAHQEAIARVAVRDDHERKRRRRPVEPARRRARPCRDSVAVTAGSRVITRYSPPGFWPARQRRRIPDLERQRAVVARRRAAFLGVEDVGPVLVGDLDRPHADVVAGRNAASSGADGVTVSMRFCCASRAAGQEAGGDKERYRFRIIPLDPPGIGTSRTRRRSRAPGA